MRFEIAFFLLLKKSPQRYNLCCVIQNFTSNDGKYISKILTCYRIIGIFFFKACILVFESYIFALAFVEVETNTAT